MKLLGCGFNAHNQITADGDGIDVTDFVEIVEGEGIVVIGADWSSCVCKF